MSTRNPFRVIRSQLERAMILLNQADFDQHTALSWAVTVASRLYPLDGQEPNDVNRYKFIANLEKDIIDAYDELSDEELFKSASVTDRQRALVCIEKADRALEDFINSSSFDDLKAAFELEIVERELVSST